MDIDHRVDQVTIAPPTEEDHDFSEERFLHAEAKRDYRLRFNNKKKIIFERGLDVKEPDVAYIFANIEKRGW